MSAEIPASLVKELRDMSGAGMMECKRALVEANGDLDEAFRLLREKGMAAAAKRAGRKTTEGKVLARIDNGKGAIVAVGSETEPVSANEEFLGFAQHVLDVVEVEGPEAVKNLEDERVALVARLGENIEVVGAQRFESAEEEVLSAYIHPPANKIGVLVKAHGSPELARLVAMHISFANPQYLTREQVPAETVAEERAIYEKLPDVTSKPEDVRPKVVEGMLAKRFFAASVLAEQPWIHDTGRTVAQALAEDGAEVHDFVRYAVAESEE
jgi:elongation factor Ts